MDSVWTPFVIFDRVRTRYKGRSKLQDYTQAMLIFATTLELKEGAPSLSTYTVELANDGHGEHRASRDAGDGAHCSRE